MACTLIQSDLHFNQVTCSANVRFESCPKNIIGISCSVPTQIGNQTLFCHIGTVI